MGWRQEEAEDGPSHVTSTPQLSRFSSQLSQDWWWERWPEVSNRNCVEWKQWRTEKKRFSSLKCCWTRFGLNFREEPLICVCASVPWMLRHIAFRCPAGMWVIACSLQCARSSTTIWTGSSSDESNYYTSVERFCQMIPVDFASRHVLLSDWSGQWSYGIV